MTNSSRASLRFALGAVLLCAALLFLVLRMWNFNPWVPLEYDSDALYSLAVAKAIAQHHLPWLNPNLGAPFGANWLDFPIFTTVDSIFMLFLTAVTRQPGLLVNALWITATCATAATACWAFQRLGVTPRLALALGAIYAVQPFTFARGIAHLNLVYYAVPLLAAAAMEIASGRLSGRIPRYIWIGCLLQGFSYVYDAFFACFVFSVATLLVWLTHRRRSAQTPETTAISRADPLVPDATTQAAVSAPAAAPTRAAVAQPAARTSQNPPSKAFFGLKTILLLAAFSALNLSPSIFYTFLEGNNPGIAYKNAAESEVYALKLRQAFTPNPNDPIAPLRAIARTIQSAHFIGDTENATSRLGTVASIALLYLLGIALLACLPGRPPLHPLTGAAAALALASILLATDGGFGALFNVFVAADVRAYNRIIVFIVFFALAAAGLALTRFWDRFVPHRVPEAAALAVLIAISVVSAYDQADVSRFLNYSYRGDRFWGDQAFVRSVETSVPAGASIFQIPFTDFPLDVQHVQMNVYDHARPYLHSRSTRWSWGALSERKGQLNQFITKLPPDRMTAWLAAAGFAGLWVDLGGYAPSTSPEPALTALLGPPMLSPGGRIAFYHLNPAAAASLSPEERNQARAPLFTEYTDGFYPAESNGAETWRWCGKMGRIQFINSLNQMRSVDFTTTLRTGYPAPSDVEIEVNGVHQHLAVSSAGTIFKKRFNVPAGGKVEIWMMDNGQKVQTAPGDFRTALYLQLVNPVIHAEP